MEKGGAGKLHPPYLLALAMRFDADGLPLRSFPDIIELGVPFTDPIADGPTIQTSNTVR